MLIGLMIFSFGFMVYKDILNEGFSHKVTCWDCCKPVMSYLIALYNLSDIEFYNGLLLTGNILLFKTNVNFVIETQVWRNM